MPGAEPLYDGASAVRSDAPGDERKHRLYFADILNRTIFGLDVASGDLMSWGFESEVGSLGLTVSGQLVVALTRGARLLAVSPLIKNMSC